MTLTYSVYEGKIICYEDPAADCHVVFLAESKLRNEFHSDSLANATKEINAILQRVAESEEAEGRTLRLITTPEGLMLAWAHCGELVSASGDPGAVREALGLGA